MPLCFSPPLCEPQMALLARPAARLLRLPQAPLVVVRTRTAFLSTTAPRRNATPDWEQLIGGRAGVERRRAEFQDRYRDALEAKARAEGISVEELKQRALDEAAKKKATRKATATGTGDVMGGGQEAAATGGPVEAGSMDTRKTAEQLEGGKAAEVVKPLPSAAVSPSPSPSQPKKPLAPKKSDSPVKVSASSLYHLLSVGVRANDPVAGGMTALERHHGPLESFRPDHSGALATLDRVPPIERVLVGCGPARDLLADAQQRAKVPALCPAARTGGGTARGTGSRIGDRDAPLGAYSLFHNIIVADSSIPEE